MKAKLYTDGGARPTNPGPSGFACILVTEDGDEKAVARCAGRGTNNRAEYMAVIVGLKMAIEDSSIDYLEIITDSQLVINQVLGNWQIREHRLRPLVSDVKKLLSKFDGNWKFTHVKGHSGDEFNERCDELCTSVILAQRDRNPWRQRLRAS